MKLHFRRLLGLALAALILVSLVPVPTASAAAVPDVLAIGPYTIPPPPKITDIVWKDPIQKKGYDGGRWTKAYTESSSRANNGFATDDHVVKFPDGSINFLGYGEAGRVDYIWSDNDAYEMIDTLTFTLSPKSMNFHTFSQTAFLFNGSLSGNSYTGYAVVLGDDGILGLYKGTFSLVDNAGDYGTGGHPFKSNKRVATYASGITNGSTKTYTIKMIVDPTKANRPFSIYVNGEQKTPTTNSEYGSAHGLGFVTGYHSHACSVLTVINYSKIGMTMDPSVTAETNFPDKSTVTTQFLINGKTTEIADRQQYTATQLYRSYNVISVPQSIAYDGKTYKLIRAEPSVLLNKDSSGNYNYSAPFPTQNETVKFYYDDIAVSKTAAYGGVTSTGASNAPIQVSPGGTISYSVSVSSGAAALTGGSPLNVIKGAVDHEYSYANMWGKNRSRWDRDLGNGIMAYTTDFTIGDSQSADIDSTHDHEVLIPLGTWPQGTYTVTVPASEWHYNNTNKDHVGNTLGAQIIAGSTTVNAPLPVSGKFNVIATNSNITGFDPTAAANKLDFGTFTITDANPTVYLKLWSNNNWALNRQDSAPDASFGFIVGVPQVFRDNYVIDNIPAGLTYVAGSAKINGGTPGANIILLNGQALQWNVEGLPANTTRTLTFNATVNAGQSSTLYTNLAALHYGASAFDTNGTYHWTPGPVRVTEKYIEQLNEVTIKDSTFTDVPVGNNYAKTPDAAINHGGVGYGYVGYRWDDETTVHTGNPNIAAASIGFGSHTITYVYKDNRGYATIHEYYRVYNGAPTGTSVPGKADTSSILGSYLYDSGTAEYRVEDYLLPMAKLGDIAYDANTYTYYGYKINNGPVVYIGADRYPQDPLFTGLALNDESNSVTYYFAINPKYTVEYHQCGVAGNDMGALPGYNNVVTQMTYGELLYFDEAFKNPLGEYKYYGYAKNEASSATPGSPSPNTLEENLTTNYTLKLYYAKAYQLTVTTVEMGNVYNMLRKSVQMAVDLNGSVPSSQFDTATFDVEGKTYTYAGYSVDGGTVYTTQPPNQTTINADRQLQLFFSTTYNLTVQYHENISNMPSDGDEDAQVPVDLGIADKTVTVNGGATASTGIPPTHFTRSGYDWSLAGYKNGGDNAVLTTETTGLSVDVTDMWSDQMLTFAYTREGKHVTYDVRLQVETLDPDGVPVGLSTAGKTGSTGLGGSVAASGTFELDETGESHPDDWFDGLLYTLTADRSDGYAFAGWTLTSATDTGTLAAPDSTTAATFEPKKAALLTASFKKGFRTTLFPEDVDQTEPREEIPETITVEAENTYPNAVSISGMRWFRVPLNGNNVTSMTAAQFETGYAAAGDDDKATQKPADWGYFEGNEEVRWGQISADQNARYWVYVKYEGYDVDTNLITYEDVVHYDVTNIYTPFDVYVRDVSDDTIIRPYTRILAVGGLPTAIPYDLNGVSTGAVLLAPGPSPKYRTVRFDPFEPEYRATYDITQPDGSAYGGNALDVLMDGDFLSFFTANADDVSGHKYTIDYARNTTDWVDITVHYINENGYSLFIDKADSGTIRVNTTDKAFDEAGGYYFPPVDPNDVYVSIGYLVAPGTTVPYPFDPSFVTLVDDFTNFGYNFYGDLAELQSDAKRFYVVFRQNTGVGGDVYRVTEHHYLYDGGVTTEKVHADTFTRVETQNNYIGVPLNLSGVVVVGYKFGSGQYISPPFTGLPDESQVQYFTVTESITGSVEVSYYYEASTTYSPEVPYDPTGIPDSQLGKIVVRWREMLPLDSDPDMEKAGWRVKPSEVHFARIGTEFFATNNGLAHGSSTDYVDVQDEPGAKWIFAAEKAGFPSNATERTITVAAENEINFYYLYATDGVHLDQEYYIIVSYVDASTGLEVVPTDGTGVRASMYQSPLTDTFTKNAPKYAGYIAVGVYEGDYGANVSENDIDTSTTTIVVPPRSEPHVTRSFIYRRGAEYTAYVNGQTDKITSSTLVLSFDTPVVTLPATSIGTNGVIKGDDGAQATVTGGTPSGDGKVWTFGLENVVEDGDHTLNMRNYVTVPIAPTGGLIFGLKQIVELKKGPTLLTAEFTGGSPDVRDSTALVLSFDKPIILASVNYGLVDPQGESKPAIVEFTGGAVGSDSNKVWTFAITEKSAANPTSGVTQQGTTDVTVYAPATHTVEGSPINALAHAEKRSLEYDGNGSESGTVPGTLTSELLTQTVAGNPGGLYREGYTLYAWNTLATGFGTRYLPGADIVLDSPVLSGPKMLYAEWLAPPVPKISAPVEGVTSNIMTFSGRVTRGINDFKATLQYRPRGGGDGEWMTVFENRAVTRDEITSSPGYLPGGALTWYFSVEHEGTFIKTVEYEVRLTAWDSLVPNFTSFDTIWFLLHVNEDDTGGGAGGGADVSGAVVNNTGKDVDVTVTLNKGDTELIPPQPITFTMAATDGATEDFVFQNVPDGYYNVVADTGEYRVTRGVLVKDGRAYDALTDSEAAIILTLGKEQSLVKITDSHAPRAAVDDLPSLFATELYTPPDRDVVNTGGTVEMRFEVSQLSGGTNSFPELDAPTEIEQEAFEEQALLDKSTITDYLDFTLYKTLFDSLGIKKSETTIPSTGDNLLIAFELPETYQTQAMFVLSVYRMHNGAVESIRYSPNGGGEYFRLQNGYLLLYVHQFSTYALAVHFPVAQGGPGVNTDDDDDGDEGGATETGEHIAYVRGYPNGTVKPEGLLTRAEAAMIFYRLTADVKNAEPVARQFPDVTDDKWYAQAVNYLEVHGILHGYPDGQFHPNATITRAELTAIIERLHADEQTEDNPFSDLSAEHWAYRHILSGVAKGWITGYPDGTFRPDASITRAEAVMLVNGWLDRRRFVEDFVEQHPSPYPDLTSAHWAYKDLIEASIEHTYHHDAEYEIWEREVGLTNV